MRSTKQRSAISAPRRHHRVPFGPGIARRTAPTRPGHRRTTVYRTLQTLAEAGTVDVLRTDTGESVYRRCSSGTTTISCAAPADSPWGRRARRRTVVADHRRHQRVHRRQPHGRDLRTCRDCAQAR
ncbi:transcriptional repressor [Rhodococcus hoagii]|nr:transcriptional repressor [Prescottella equi]